MKKTHTKYQIVQNLLSAIGNPKRCSRFVNDLKNIDDFDKVNRIVSKILRVIPPFEKKFFGNAVPKTIEELGNEKVFFYKPKSLKNEINWTILGIKQNLDIINKFLKYKILFEHQVLLGKYYDAIEALNAAEKELGVSIWLYESKFVVYEMMGAQDKSLSLISQINEARRSNEKRKNKDYGFVTLLLYYLWNRSKKDLSAIKYDEDLFNQFKKNRTDFQVDTYNYHLFRLNYFVNYKIKDTSIPLVMESVNSIIDRYIVLLQVLKSSFLNEENRDVVLYRSQYLYKLTHDRDLLPYIHFNTDFVNNDKNYFDEAYITILDLFYRGNYSAVIKLCKNYIENETSNFDVAKFYCYSLLLKGDGYSPIYSDYTSPINQICSKIYDAISGKENSAILYNLYQFNKNLYGFSIATGLDYFIKEENNTSKSDLLRLLSLKVFDPLYSTIYSDDKDALMYLEKGLRIFKKSTSIEHQIRRVKNEITPNGIVAEYLTEIDNAKVLYLKGDYNNAFKVWTNILQTNRENYPICQTAIRFSFDCLIKLGKYQEAIALFVNEYIKNHISIKKTDVTSFLQLLKNQRYKNIRRTIELPIFVGLNSQEDTDKSFVLQSFCNYYDVKKPSELFELICEYDEEKIETFFSVIITEDILRHCMYINSTQENLEEKQKILGFLINLKTEREPIYRKMADEVLEALIVYTGTKKIDESKIYVNDQAIIKYELTDIEGLYKSFYTQYNLLETGTFLLVDAGSLSNAASIEGTIIKANVKYTDNAIYQVAYALYDTIRDKFLFSKFGLGTYLSTRIRHGVLEGELRSAFVEHNLILNKSNDKYVENSYWISTYALDSKTNGELYIILSNFSEQVDTLISNFKSDILQIKIEKEGKGYFDYYIDEESLSIKALEIASNSKDSQELCHLVIKNLWEITERNLSNIRTYIKIELSLKFHNLFDDTLQKINMIQSPHLKKDMVKCINDVRAIFSQKLLRIEGWFYFQEYKFDNFNLQNLIKMAWDSTRKFYPKMNIECQLNIQGADLTIKALYGIHFSDILRIFLTNMFKYCCSDIQFNKTFNAQIKTTIENEVLFLTFENEINTNECELNRKFQSLMNSQGRLQIEGGSGLVKAQKIVKYDLDDLDNYVNIKAQNKKCTAIIRINLKNLIA